MTGERDSASSWLCLKCGRAGRVEHQEGEREALILALAVESHTARCRAKFSRASTRCGTDPRFMRLAIGSRDIPSLCAKVRIEVDYAF
jgi:hypothetical protein